MPETHNIGTPPRPVAEWLRLFARDCGVIWTVNPVRRIRLRARAEAFNEAADLIDQSTSGNRSPFPVSLEPGEHVTVDFQLYPKGSDA
jgi:hypothetical protein